MNRTRAQRRLRRKGYTWEMGFLSSKTLWGKQPWIISGGNVSWRIARHNLFPGEVIRPIAAHCLHNGRKPR